MKISLYPQILKIDTETGDVPSWKDPGHFVSEPVFVPRPINARSSSITTNGHSSSSEDEGLLVFTLLSPAALNNVQLVLLDAADLSEVARVTYRATGTVTEGFHGIFVMDDETGWRY